MRKLIPVLLFTFCGSAVFSQTSSDRNSDNKDNSFAESLRQEIVSGIKKKMSADTTFSKSQEVMSEYYKACGVQMAIKKCPQPDPGKGYKFAPDNIALILKEN